jgi:hypothetical protein
MAGIIEGNQDLLGKTLNIANLVSGGGGSASNNTGIAGSQPNSEDGTALESKILANYFESKGIPLKVGMAGVAEETKQGLKMYRQSKTILAIKKLNPTTAQVHFFTLDDEATFNQLVKFWMDKLKEAGGNLIYDSEIEPNIVKALQAAGVRLQQSDNPKYKLMGYL